MAINMTIHFTDEDAETLRLARETYGPHKQVGVAAEECTELAKELIRAFRYDDFEAAIANTKDNVVEEVADVLIVLQHIFKLYRITNEDLSPQIKRKIQRLSYWLSHSNSSEFTTQCRDVPDEDEPIPEQLDAFDQIQDQATISSPAIGVYKIGDILLVDRNDAKYRKDRE